MEKVKLFRILSAFTKTEIKEFSGFISTPYFNRGGKYLVRFFNILKEFYPAFNSEKFTRENIYQLMYPGEEYNDVRMRKLFSGMQKLAEDFLSVSAFRKDKYEVKQYLLEEFSARRLDNLFELHSKEAEKIIEAMPERNDTYYYYRYMLNRKIKYYYSFRDRRISLEYYDREINNFYSYYMLFMLNKYVERLKEKKSFTQRGFNMPMFGEVMAYIESEGFRDTPLMELFYNELKLYTDGDEKYYTRLKELMRKYEKNLSINELKNLYGTLANFCTEQYERGDEKYFNELFKLYKEILAKDLIEQYLSEYLFLNIVTVSLYLNELKFTEEFVNGYSARLNPVNAFNIINYSKANINFKKKDYGSALQHLLKVNFADNIQKTLVKNLTLKIYYELNETEAFVSLLDSYRHQVKREKYMPDSIRQLLYNFIDHAGTLMDIKNGSTEVSIKELKKKIAENPAADKKWLIEKAEKL